MPYSELSRTRIAVFPDPPGSKAGDAPAQFLGRQEPTAILFPADYDARSYWAFATQLSLDETAYIPPGNFGPLECSLHELRHLIQVESTNAHHFSFYAEVDSELFARDALKETGKANEFLEAELNARYIQIVFTSAKQYYIAPVLEAIEKGHPVPHARDVTNSADLVLNAMVKEHENYCDMRDTCKDPQMLYATVQKALQDPSVKEDRLAMHIAQRIKSAVGYFCPQAEKPSPSCAENPSHLTQS